MMADSMTTHRNTLSNIANLFQRISEDDDIAFESRPKRADSESDIASIISSRPITPDGRRSPIAPIKLNIQPPTSPLFNRKLSKVDSGKRLFGSTLVPNVGAGLNTRSSFLVAAQRGSLLNTTSLRKPSFITPLPPTAEQLEIIEKQTKSPWPTRVNRMIVPSSLKDLHPPSRNEDFSKNIFFIFSFIIKICLFIYFFFRIHLFLS